MPGDELVPKFQAHDTPDGVPVLVKSTGKPEHCGAVDVKLATGELPIVIVSVTDWAQLAFDIVNVTTLVPDES